MASKVKNAAEITKTKKAATKKASTAKNPVLSPESIQKLFKSNPDLFALVKDDIKLPQQQFTTYAADPFKQWPKSKVTVLDLEQSNIPIDEGKIENFVLDNISRKIIKEQSLFYKITTAEFMRWCIWSWCLESTTGSYQFQQPK